MAKGAWTGTAWTVASIRNLFAGDDTEPIQPFDIDPYGLWSDEEKRRTSNVLPYDPAVMEALQNSGKVRC